MDSSFSNNLRNFNVLGEDFLGLLLGLGDRVAFIIKLLFFSGDIFIFGGFTKEVVCNTLFWLEDLVNKEVVLRISVTEINVGDGFGLDVSLIVVDVGDGLLGEDHLTDVHGGCFGSNLEVIVQVLQLIGQVT